LLYKELFTTVALEQEHEAAGKSCFVYVLTSTANHWVNFRQQLDNAGA